MDPSITISHIPTGDNEIEAIDFILQILNHRTFEFDPVVKSRILQYCTNRVTSEIYAPQNAVAQLAGPTAGAFKE